jgi:hypothetical protein
MKIEAYFSLTGMKNVKIEAYFSLTVMKIEVYVILAWMKIEA